MRASCFIMIKYHHYYHKYRTKNTLTLKDESAYIYAEKNVKYLAGRITFSIGSKKHVNIPKSFLYSEVSSTIFPALL